MKLSQKPKTTDRNKKRVGRGYGSGKGGHTAGRGTKGQKSRSTVPAHFDGTAHGGGFIKRLPLLRGKGKLKSHKTKTIGVNVKYLNVLPKGTSVTTQELVKHNIIDAGSKNKNVKILGDGELTVALSVMLPCSAGAQEKIKKAGGSVGQEEKKKTVTKTTSKKPAKKTNKSASGKK